MGDRTVSRHIVCCPCNRCPDRPTRWLRRFRNRPWYCPQCGRLWVTVRYDSWGHLWWEWKQVTSTPPSHGDPPSHGEVRSVPLAGEQTLTNKEVRPPVSPGQSCCDCGHEKSLHQALTMLENTRRGRCLAASGCGCESYHDINALYPARFPVHNHGPEEGAGLACRESFVGGRLIGQCMQDKETP